MLCKNCGTPIADGATKCAACGSKQKVKLAKGAALWCWLGLVANAGVFALTMILSQPSSGLSDKAPPMIVAVAAFVAAVAFVVLLCGRKEGFYILCISSLIGLIGSLAQGYFASVFLSIVNPLVTWFVIQKSWRDLNSEKEKVTQVAAAQVAAPFKPRNRIIALILAICPITAFTGVDRFYLGYTLMGLVKFITAGGFLVLYIVDIVKIVKRTRTDRYGQPLI
jgi:TM2 domain.